MIGISIVFRMAPLKAVSVLRALQYGPKSLTPLRHEIERKCLQRHADKPVVSPLGRPFNWYFDLRPLLLKGETLQMVVDAFWDVFHGEGDFQVCGLEMAAIPLVTAIVLGGNSRGRSINGLIVRKERKPHGLRRQIEGTLTPHPILVVDDLVNSGGSLEKVRTALGEQQREISGAFTVVDFQAPLGLAWRTLHHVPLTALFTLRDFGLQWGRSSLSDAAKALSDVAHSFRLVGKVAEIREVAREISCAEDLWTANTSRQRNLHVQREIECISLRNGCPDESTDMNDCNETSVSPFAERFPIIMDLLTQIAAQLHGKLCRAMIVRLRPGGRVHRHIDWGKYYLPRDRYHIVVTNNPGSSLTCGRQTIAPREGEVWWLDNKQTHAAFNSSESPRIHIILDLLPFVAGESR
jgi:orotate phosphoribosyltransferase